MTLEGKKVGVAFTGASECFRKTFIEIKKISTINHITLIPIMSFNCYKLNTKYGKAKELIKEIENITENKVIHTIQEAEKINYGLGLDILMIAPCTGNTISKLSYDIIDTPVTVTAKFHLRNDKPIVLGISSNNGLSDNAENIGRLLNRKNYYFIPFRQTNPITKPYSIMYETKYIKKTIEYALNKKQIQPIIL